ELGVGARRKELRAALDAGVPGSLEALAWHLFSSGASSELALLGVNAARSSGAEIAVLVAHGAYDVARTTAALRDLEQAVALAPDFALGRILLGEALLVQVLHQRGAGASFLDDAVLALRPLMLADPSTDRTAIARVFGWFHRGRVEIAL